MSTVWRGSNLRKKRQEVQWLWLIEWRKGTLRDLQLPACVSESWEQVQLDASLGAQIALQMLSLLLHGWQGGQQHVRLFLHALVLSQSLGPHNTSEHAETSAQLPHDRLSHRFGFPSVLDIFFLCFLYLHAHLFKCFHLGNQSATEKTGTTHWWWIGQPFKKHESCIFLQRYSEVLILSLFPLILTCSHYEGHDLCSFIKAVQCFYERPGFCFSMLHGEYATKIKSNTTQYDDVHTLCQNNTNNHTIMLHTDDGVQHFDCKPK